MKERDYINVSHLTVIRMMEHSLREIIADEIHIPKLESEAVQTLLRKWRKSLFAEINQEA